MDGLNNTTPTTAAAAAPTPRAFHASWTFENNVYVHGGEGAVGAASESFTNLELDDVIGCVGRDPFAEEDGGAPLESGRVVNGATAPRAKARTKDSAADAATTGARNRKEGKELASQDPAGGAQRRPTVSVLEDLWKLDPRTLRWERVSVVSRSLRGDWLGYTPRARMHVVR